MAEVMGGGAGRGHSGFAHAHLILTQGAGAGGGLLPIGRGDFLGFFLLGRKRAGLVNRGSASLGIGLTAHAA
ncbi:MAG: hypothetical protein KDE04_17630, partial [Anaerolineales bacterium]|nr:hypothetical protein [Anaerolineales bacterium]